MQTERADTMSIPQPLFGGPGAPRSALEYTAIGIFLMALLVQATSALVRSSCTYDEPANVRTGLAALVFREFSPSAWGHHPPLPFMWGVLPLSLSPDVNLPKSFGEIDGVRVLWQQGDGHRLLMRCRITTLILSVALALIVYAFARDLGGPASGLLALALYAFCPNVLAHSCLLTNDLSASAGLTGASYALWATFRRTSSSRPWLTGIVSGLALGSKLTGVLVLPLVFLLPAIRLAAAGTNEPINARIVAWSKTVGWLILPAGLALWAQYGFDIELRRFVPVPAPAYWDAWGRLLVHASEGHSSYLAGEISQHGWWHYYFVAIALKTPLGLMGLWIVAVGMSVPLVRGRALGALAVLLPAGLLLAAATVSGQNIGIRHVLPIYPLTFIWVGQLASPDLRFFARRWLLGGLLAAHMIASLSIAPHYLAYFNEFAGGPSGGSRWLADSNLDWGQGLIELKAWMRTNGIDEIALEYFGVVKPSDYGVDSRPLVPGETGWMAISVNRLIGLYLPDADRFAWLRNRVPHARAGYSILIFQGGPPDATTDAGLDRVVPQHGGPLGI